MTDPDNLSPPKRTGTADPGAHDLESSESEDHFSDAQSAPPSPADASPIPRTRVEKVSDEPSYGEVPGTEAYRRRQGDAEPDEIAIIPDEANPTNEKLLSPSSPPGDRPIPRTVVEEAEGDLGPHSEEFEKKHRADAPPDLILRPDGTVEAGDGGDSSTDSMPSGKSPKVPESPISPALMSPKSGRARRRSSRHLKSPLSPDAPPSSTDEGGDDDDFGDDFDDFEDGDEDGEFDDFEDGFQQPAPSSAAAAPPPPITLSFPIPDFEGLDMDDISNTMDPYINALFPPEYDLPELPPPSRDNPIFLTPRSASLWAQLVTPPPLAPPDWIRSRIRRLFLVSLGVPVDLDEILPASKQKKLVLPSLNTTTGASPRTSTDSRSVTRLKKGGANASSTSIDSQGRPSSKKRKGPPVEPDFDLVSARQVCMTTDEALDGMTVEELKDHVAALETMEVRAKAALEYWQKRTDEKIGDREAFEGVIENLVKHARKVRK